MLVIFFCRLFLCSFYLRDNANHLLISVMEENISLPFRNIYGKSLLAYKRLKFCIKQKLINLIIHSEQSLLVISFVMN
uniref:Secreted protein n=1 Tax=Setaria viridis TaxID=4556 RepID=A0A4U6TD99_SETVI|nr:hypothetical protein SEVIR_9G341950v2 [Setaria viridis]